MFLQPMHACPNLRHNKKTYKIVLGALAHVRMYVREGGSALHVGTAIDMPRAGAQSSF